MRYCRWQAIELLTKIDNYLGDIGVPFICSNDCDIEGHEAVSPALATVIFGEAWDSLEDIITEFLENFGKEYKEHYELTPFEYELLKHFQDEGYELVGKSDGELWFGCEYADDEIETQEVSGIYNILKFIDDDDRLKIERILDCSEICSAPINK